MRGKVKFLLTSLAVLEILVFGGVHVYSQMLCYFTSTDINPGEGDNVPAGQPVQFQITLYGSCSAPGIYTIRADLINPVTKAAISTTRGPIDEFTGGEFFATLNESALAPASAGTWSLQLSVYMFLNGESIATPSQELFHVNIIPYAAPSTSATMEATILESTTSITSLIQSSSIQTSATPLSTIVSQSQIIYSTNGNFVTEIQLAAVALVIFVILLVLFKSRRKAAKPEETRVY